MNLLKQFMKSLYSPKDIAKFRFQGIGKTILYVFLLTLISVLPTSYFSTTAIIEGLDVAMTTFENDIPPFVIENGQLSLEESTPIIIEKEEFKILLDSTGTVQTTDIEETDNTIALLKDEFLFVVGGQSQSYSYAMFSDLRLTNQDLVDFIHSVDNIKLIFLPVMFLIIYIFSSGIKFIEVSILALFGILLTKLIRKNIPYRQLWRMGAYSITLPTVFFAIMSILQTEVPNAVVINWFVSIMVLSLALKEIPVKKQK